MKTGRFIPNILFTAKRHQSRWLQALCLVLLAQFGLAFGAMANSPSLVVETFQSECLEKIEINDIAAPGETSFDKYHVLRWFGAPTYRCLVTQRDDFVMSDNSRSTELFEHRAIAKDALVVAEAMIKNLIDNGFRTCRSSDAEGRHEKVLLRDRKDGTWTMVHLFFINDDPQLVLTSARIKLEQFGPCETEIKS